jgi:pimeloyl-ACP methyl ester carboxylesterase
LELLDAIGSSRAVLVGHDWGALVAYVAATLAPERVGGLVTLGIPHPSVLTRTPASLWAVRHFFALKLPWAARTCRRRDFAYLDTLYRRWAPGWSGPERDESLRRAKQALSTEATLDGALAYYRDLPLGGSPAPVLVSPPTVPGLIVGGSSDLPEPEALRGHPERMPGPSRPLIVDRAGHWPHRRTPRRGARAARVPGPARSVAVDLLTVALAPRQALGGGPSAGQHNR